MDVIDLIFVTLSSATIYIATGDAAITSIVILAPLAIIGLLNATLG